jgi:hypothetical protein
MDGLTSIRIKIIEFFGESICCMNGLSSTANGG